MNGKESAQDLLVKVLSLKGILDSSARGENPPEDEYTTLRSNLISQIRPSLPVFVQSARTLKEFWRFIQPKFRSYKERTDYIQAEFDTLLTDLELGAVPGAVSSVADLFRHQFPIGLPFGLTKPHVVVMPRGGSQVTMFEDEPDLGVIRGAVYPDFTFKGLQAAVKGTPIAATNLEDKLVALSQTTSEASFYRHCATEYRMFTDNIPILIPQAWLQWHSKTKPDLRTAGSPYAADLYRVDFVAFWKGRRFAILIDDISHYGKKNTAGRWDADEGQYSSRLKEDRKLRKEGWDVFRVSNWEIRNGLLQEILVDLREFLTF